MRLEHLTDQTLLADTKSLAARERRITTELLWHIKEVDRRKLYCDLKQPSLWAYLVHELKYSEGAAQRRIVAARALGTMPHLERKIQEGSLNLNTISTVMGEFKFAPPEKQARILADVENKSGEEVKDHIAKIKGQPRFYTIKIDEEAWDLRGKLQALKPSEPDPVKYALKETVEVTERKRFNLVSKPRASSGAQVVRTVFGRDQGKCSNCGSIYRLEIDHRRPKSMGGADTAENLRILCRSCNQRAAFRQGLQPKDRMKLT